MQKVLCGLALAADARPVDPDHVIGQHSHNIRVQSMLTGHVPHDLQSFARLHAGPVGTVFGQRGKNVRHSHDPGGQGNLMRSQAQRVALAVQALMMQTSPLADAGKAPDVFHQPQTDAGMLLDNLKLGGCDGGRFFQNLKGNGQLAEIVQQARRKDGGERLRVGQAALFEQGAGRMSNAAGVRGRKWLLESMISENKPQSFNNCRGPRSSSEKMLLR